MSSAGVRCVPPAGAELAPGALLLAVVCEQAGEAVHHKFKQCKARYQRNKYHTKHGKAQRKAVVNWSSWNIHPINRSTMQRYREKTLARRVR